MATARWPCLGRGWGPVGFAIRFHFSMGAAMMTVDHIIFSYRAIVHHQHHHDRRWYCPSSPLRTVARARRSRWIYGRPLFYHRNRGLYSSVATGIPTTVAILKSLRHSRETGQLREPLEPPPFSRPYVPILTSPRAPWNGASFCRAHSYSFEHRRLRSRRSAATGPRFARSRTRSSALAIPDKSRGSRTKFGERRLAATRNGLSQRRATRTHVQEGDAHRVWACTSVFTYTRCLRPPVMRMLERRLNDAPRPGWRRARGGDAVHSYRDDRARGFDNLEINRRRRRSGRREEGRRFYVRARARGFLFPSHFFTRCRRRRTRSRWNLRQTKNGAARYHCSTIERRVSAIWRSWRSRRGDQPLATSDPVVLIEETAGTFGSSMARTSGLCGPHPPLHTTRR